MHMYTPPLPLVRSCSIGYALCVSVYTKQDELNQYLYVYMEAVQGFHKAPLKLLTFKRLRPSLNPAAALWPSHSIILITFCEKAGWRGIIAACWHLFTSRGKGGGGARRGIKKKVLCVCVCDRDWSTGWGFHTGSTLVSVQGVVLITWSKVQKFPQYCHTWVLSLVQILIISTLLTEPDSNPLFKHAPRFTWALTVKNWLKLLASLFYCIKYMQGKPCVSSTWHQNDTNMVNVAMTRYSSTYL